jgi:hypothetical protein
VAAPEAFKLTGLENLGKLLEIQVVGLELIMFIGSAREGVKSPIGIGERVFVHEPPLEAIIVKLPGPTETDCCAMAIEEVLLIQVYELAPKAVKVDVKPGHTAFEVAA